MSPRKKASPTLYEEVLARPENQRILALIGGQGLCGTCGNDWNRHFVGPGDADGVWCLGAPGHSVSVCTFPPSAGQWGTWHGMTADDSTACVYRLGDGWAWKWEWECSCGAPGVHWVDGDLKHEGLVANRDSTFWQIATHLRLAGAPQAEGPA